MSIRTLLRPAARQRGEMDMSAETAVLALGIITLLGLTITLGWISHTETSLQSAASSAAREVSLLRDSRTASTAGEDAARRAIEAQGLTCHGVTVTVDPSGLQAPLGEIGIVSVSIECTIPLLELPLAGTPITTTITATGTNPVDRYRERS